MLFGRVLVPGGYDDIIDYNLPGIEIMIQKVNLLMVRLSIINIFKNMRQRAKIGKAIIS